LGGVGMKKQAVCEYCGEVFKENEDDHYYVECAEHEISHLNLEEQFNKNIKVVLESLVISMIQMQN
jgi:hypothetical protein